MISALKRLFGIAQTNRPTVTMRAGETFQWRRGLRLQAVEDSQLAFPGGLVRDGERFGSIVEVDDDDAEMGFKQRPDGSFEVIYLRIRAGCTVALHRPSDVLLVAPDGQQRVFYVLSDTNDAG